jgi:hypothetical protein
MNMALSIGSATLRHIGHVLNQRNATEARAMKRVILFTAITALILGMSGLRPALANGALNHGSRLTVKIARPGLVEKVHHRRFSRGRGHRISRGRGHRISRGRGHRISRGRGHRVSRGYHRHFYYLFSGLVVSQWHWHGRSNHGRRYYRQGRHHR